GTTSVPAADAAPDAAAGTRIVDRSGLERTLDATSSARSLQAVEAEAQARRKAASRVRASGGLAGSTFAAVRRCANGLRSLPTPIRPSAQAWSGVVPRPLNGSRTTSPGRE